MCGKSVVDCQSRAEIGMAGLGLRDHRELLPSMWKTTGV